jgi:hypothetical protein
MPKVACTASGKLVVASGSEVKLMNPKYDMTLFSNYPCSPIDLVYINLNSADLKFLLKSCESNTNDVHVEQFFSQFLKTFDGQRA